ncbi:MAG: YbaK/EbsC family protein [Candidatus Omnitrophica bacterium]|nr:YbaK/EbsC family protein [Candidatus Omnitrophota bacterium]
MAVSAKLEQFLRENRVKFLVMQHSLAYTAQEIAAAVHVSGKQMAKCVLVRTHQNGALAVLPATHRVDFKKLKSLLRAKTVSIATEEEIKQRFPDVEVGAMSPFGNLYQVPVILEKTLADAEEFVFNAGSHTDTITMRAQDVIALVKPVIGIFGQPSSPKKKKSVVRKNKKKTAPKRKSKTRAVTKKRKPRLAK